jgi:pSer/pThr/pTyr-binding forkhead associated (FHA) protein
MPDTPSQRATIQGEVSVVPVAKPLRPHFLELLRGVSAVPRYELNKAEMVLGREPGVDLMLSGDQVSRRHALLRRRNQEYTIIDLDSSHGIYLNGVKVHSALLRDEDVVQLADVVFVYHEA